jgi:hypothetical protein
MRPTPRTVRPPGHKATVNNAGGVIRAKGDYACGYWFDPYSCKVFGEAHVEMRGFEKDWRPGDIVGTLRGQLVIR